MNRYSFMAQEEIMIEEEIKQNLFDKMIRKYGFEHIYTITFAGYVEMFELNECYRVFDMLYNRG